MKCPKCNSKNIAKIMWGLHVDIDAIQVQLESQQIVLGGCTVTGDDPKGECNDCHNR